MTSEIKKCDHHYLAIIQDIQKSPDHSKYTVIIIYCDHCGDIKHEKNLFDLIP